MIKNQFFIGCWLFHLLVILELQRENLFWWSRRNIQVTKTLSIFGHVGLHVIFSSISSLGHFLLLWLV
jgi:hypothetical protein